jgi:hypothetical protein
MYSLCVSPNLPTLFPYIVSAKSEHSYLILTANPTYSIVSLPQASGLQATSDRKQFNSNNKG